MFRMVSHGIGGSWGAPKYHSHSSGPDWLDLSQEVQSLLFLELLGTGTEQAFVSEPGTFGVWQGGDL